MSFESRNSPKELQEQREKDFSSMTYDELVSDPETRPIIEQVALEHLKYGENHREYFEREFTGEIVDEFFLVDRKGNAHMTAAMHNYGLEMDDIRNEAIQRLKKMPS